MVRLNFFIILLVSIPMFLYFRLKKYKSRENFSVYREAIVILFFIYVLAVSYLTLKPFHFNFPLLGGRAFTFDFNLFYELRNMAAGHHQKKVLYSVGNIVMFVPFGVLVPLLYKPAQNFFKILGLGFVCSLTIELTQAIFTTGRTATVDDLFFNTIGAVIGYLLFLGLKGLSKYNRIIEKIIDLDQ